MTRHNARSDGATCRWSGRTARQPARGQLQSSSLARAIGQQPAYIQYFGRYRLTAEQSNNLCNTTLQSACGFLPGTFRIIQGIRVTIASQALTLKSRKTASKNMIECRERGDVCVY